MSSKNDDAAANNQAKRRQSPGVSDVIGNRENRNNTDNHSTTSNTTTKYIVRTGDAPITPLIPVTIFPPYVRPPNKSNHH